VDEFVIMTRAKTLEFKVSLRQTPAHTPVAAWVRSDQAQNHAAYLAPRGRILGRLDGL
jgi:hypothetical protein